MAQLAVGYLCLQQPEKQKDSLDGIVAAFIPPVHDIYSDVAPYTPSTGIRYDVYDIMSRVTVVGNKPTTITLPACRGHTAADGGP